MKKTLSTCEAAEILMHDIHAAWTRAGAFALVEYLEELEEDLGETMEFDAVAIRCDFSQYGSLEDFAVDYFSDSKQAADALGIELMEDREIWDASEDEVNEAIREYIMDNGQLIEFDGGIIVSAF